MTEIAYLTPTEIAHARGLLGDFPEAQAGLDMLIKHRGNPQTSVEELTARKSDTARFSIIRSQPSQSVWKILLDQLYIELCGEDTSLREMVTEAKRNPDNSPLLTGLIVYLVGLANLPINPAIATVLVLYILKIGISTFCEYTGQFRQTERGLAEGTA